MPETDKESGARPAHGDAVKQLALLRKLARLVETSADLEETLNAALGLLAAELGMMAGAITLVAPKSGRIRIEASWGLNAEQRKRGVYAPGEGVTGRVIATGQPMCMADVSQEPLFLNRTRSRDLKRGRIAFLCAPIKLNGHTVGALSVDRLATGDAPLEEELELLGIIAALIAHTACESQELIGDADVRPSRPRGFVGNSLSMRQVYDQIAIVSPSMTTVFLQGESGTGKELAARAIHNASPRAKGPFVSLNCAALPESLIESELFGHERGAFTGAAQKRIGRFELARGGTIFLDEVGELSPLVQAKLLRVLQERTFERLGGMETLRADCRVITATNRDLAQMTGSGDFRRDLFYRLNVFPIRLPPLRERQEDIPPLAAHFLGHFAARGKPPRISPSAMELLQRHAWPGNIRELQNVMERAALLLGNENLLLPRHLPESMQNAEARKPEPDETGNLRQKLEQMEKFCIAEALEAAGGHLNQAAAMLGLTERIMGLRVKKYGLDYRDYRKKSVSAACQTRIVKLP